MPKWYEVPYKGGPMVAVDGFPRPLYPPDAAGAGKDPSTDGPDVLAYKRTVCRAGRWGTWAPDTWDDSFNNQFSHGKGTGNVKDSGIEGVQRQQGWDKDQQTGYVGEKTFNVLRSILVPEGPHEGEPAMDAEAQRLINKAFQQFKAKPPEPESSPRELAMKHQAKRVGYMEQPANSNCDSRSDGIRTAQDHCAAGTWLRYEPWCGCWCFYALEAAGVEHIDSHLASVAQIEDYARKSQKCYRGWTTDGSKVRTGDLVIVGGYGVHVEMAKGPIRADGGMPTYGGNTSPDSNGSQSNGGGAFERVRWPSEVRGYALVRYPGE